MIVILMGVTGSGKTTIGRLLSVQLGWDFVEGDDYHPPANIDKMSHGIPLTDADRDGWLAALSEAIRGKLAAGHSAIIACSALKQAYRDRLTVDPAQVRFVFLKGEFNLIHSRIAHRTGHFAGANLLASQFEALEIPRDAITVDVSRSPEEITKDVRRGLGV